MNALLAGAMAAMALAAPVLAQPTIIPSVPDWHQANMIVPPNGPGGGAAGAYRAWCTPTSAADIMGWWRDVCKFPVADGPPYASGAVIAWVPPVPPDWQDDEADALDIPIRGSGIARPVGFDLGWFLNTNDQGDQIGVPNALNNGGTPAGEQFTGTLRVNIVNGLRNYLVAHGKPAATITPTVGGVPAIAAGWANIVSEINAGRPLLGEFDHFNLLPFNVAAGLYLWGPTATSDPQTGEIWDYGQGLGHTTTIVGYWPAGSAGSPWPNDNLIVIQDNRRYNLASGLPEADNQRIQMLLPFSAAAGTPWSRNIAIDLCSPINGVVGGGGSICPGTSAIVTVTMASGDPPYTVTLNNSGGTVTSANPVTFILSPAVTTTYSVASAQDMHGCPITGVGSATITLLPVTGACCTGYGNSKVCAVVLATACSGATSPSLLYGGDCSTCGPHFCCGPDYNNSNSLEILDIFDYINAWFATAASADYNNNGTLEVIDIFDFLNAWLASC